MQDSTSCTPALLMLGWELKTPAELLFVRLPDDQGEVTRPEYARRLQDRMDAGYRFARDQLQARQKRNYDTRVRGRHFCAGELVWVYSPRRKWGRSLKLHNTCFGPRRVLEDVGVVV